VRFWFVVKLDSMLPGDAEFGSDEEYVRVRFQIPYFSLATGWD
jgi:hypothetical protein